MLTSFSNFYRIINEQTESEDQLDTHLTHLEDLVLEDGKIGFDRFKDHVNGVISYINGLKSDTNVGLKIDGAPAMFFGADPRLEFKNRFFVGSKGIFNATPKINHNSEDIDVNHGDAPGLSAKLKQALNVLAGFYDEIKGIIGNRVIQTDFLFAEKPSTETFKDGREYVTFQPQLIKYSIPVDVESELYNNVANSNIGIAVHNLWSFRENPNGTVTADKKLSDPKLIDRIAEIGKKHGVFIVNTLYKNDTLDTSIAKSDQQKIQELLEVAEANIEAISPELDDAFFPNLPEDEKEAKTRKLELQAELKLVQYFRQFINDQVKRTVTGERTIYNDALDGKDFSDTFFNETFDKFISRHEEKEVGKLSSEKGKTNKRELFRRINSRTGDFKQYLKVTHILIQIKSIILDAFNKVDEDLKIGFAYYPSKDGGFYQDRGEGFVLFRQGRNVKIVDRLSFSARNLTGGQFQKTNEGMSYKYTPAPGKSFSDKLKGILGPK